MKRLGKEKRIPLRGTKNWCGRNLPFHSNHILKIFIRNNIMFRQPTIEKSANHIIEATSTRHRTLDYKQQTRWVTIWNCFGHWCLHSIQKSLFMTILLPPSHTIANYSHHRAVVTVGERRQKFRISSKQIIRVTCDYYGFQDQTICTFNCSLFALPYKIPHSTDSHRS